MNREGQEDAPPTEPTTLARLARSVRQRLEVNRLFGWDVPLSARRLAAPAVKPGRRAPAAPSPPRAVEPRPPGGEKEALLAPIRIEVAACERCGLCQSRTQTVFGTGDAAARLLFVGEGPGYDEDRLGEPFVGKAGQLLNEIIRAMGLRRDQVYIANVVKCRPPQNRAPNPAEVGACRGYLERQIEVIGPEVIVALGSVAARTLLGVEQGIGRLRGRFHSWRSIPVMPTYHPAYLLRNPHDKRLVWEDIQRVMERLGLQPLKSP